MHKYLRMSSITFLTLFLSVTISSSNAVAKKTQAPDTTHDGLERILKSKVDLAYAKPGVDFSGYSKFLVLDSYVAFKKGWEKNYRDINRRHLSTADLEKMKTGIAELFNEVLVEELQKDEGYEIVSEPAEDVLILRPSIVNIEVTAPASRSAGRSYTFSSSAGDATLQMDVYDSLSGEILARGIDRQEAGHPGDFVTWSNGMSNRSAAKRIFKKWSRILRKRLDNIKNSKD